MKSKLKFAVVGCGRIGKRHIEQIRKLGNLVAVCDNDISVFNDLDEKENLHIYFSLIELLNDHLEIDVISICTPNGLHAQMSIECLNYGYNVLCEKPLALNVIDAGKMLESAEKNNKRLFVVKQNRFNPPVAAVKSLLNNGSLGDIFNFQLNCFWNRNEDYYKNSWKGTNDLDGGTLFTQFSHFIDLLYWFAGDISQVFGFSDSFVHKKNIEFEDTGVVCLKFKNGALGTINYTVNSFKKNMEGSLTIFGTKGTVKIGGQYLNELEYQSIEGIQIENLPKGNSPNNYGNYVGSMSNHDLVYKNIIDVLENNAPIEASAFDGYMSIQLIEKIYNVIRNPKN
ncbi:Gfo/Idh/MocA family protein [Aquirufa sp. 5-AUSEE-100C1]